MLPAGSRLRILIFSVHAILDYDEIRLFRSMGHTVFPVGYYMEGVAPNPFRPPLPFSPEERELLDLFHAEGGEAHSVMEWGHIRFTRRFVEAFDVSIVPHSAQFITVLMDRLDARPVILRTIGQQMEEQEAQIGRLRAAGVKVVRYAESEAAIPGYAGRDGMIRFAKFPEDHAGWTGEARQVLSFVNDFERRLPAELRLWREATQGLPTVLGGRGNQGIEGWAGLLDARAQRDLLRRSRAYLYAANLEVPYTLNFIEAWMTGIPVVVLRPEGSSPLSELPALIEHGRTGFFARTPAEARAILRQLLDDPAEAARIGAAGRAEAIRVFGRDEVAPHWDWGLRLWAHGA